MITNFSKFRLICENQLFLLEDVLGFQSSIEMISQTYLSSYLIQILLGLALGT